MQNHGENLADNYTSVAPATQAAVFYKGGRGALVISATTFPTTTILQYIGRGGVAINVVTVLGNGFYILDLPPGQYRLFMNAGAATAVNADLVSVRYG